LLLCSFTEVYQYHLKRVLNSNFTLYLNKRNFMKIIYIITIVLAALVFIGWLGLQVQPKSFAIPALSEPGASSVAGESLETVALRVDLPRPVDRFYRRIYGENVPVITSAIISGRGTLRLPSGKGITFPGRFRFTHRAGPIEDKEFVRQTTNIPPSLYKCARKKECMGSKSVV